MIIRVYNRRNHKYLRDFIIDVQGDKVRVYKDWRDFEDGIDCTSEVVIEFVAATEKVSVNA